MKDKRTKKHHSKKVEKNYHHGDLYASVLKEAIPLLREKGPQSFNIRELAQRLKVSGAAPYRHFKSKEEIFARIAEEGFRKMTEAFRKAIESAPLNPEEQLHNVSMSYFDFALKNPEHLQMMFGNFVSKELKESDLALRDAASQTFGTLVLVVRNCQLVAVLPAEEQSEKLAIKIWSSIHGFSVLESLGTLSSASSIDYDRYEVLRELSRSLVIGLAGRFVRPPLKRR